MHSFIARACIAAVAVLLAFTGTAQAKDKLSVTNKCSQTANVLFRHVPEKDKAELNGWWEIATNQTVELPITHVATEDLFFHAHAKNTHWDGLANVFYDGQYWGMMKSSSTPDENGDRHLTLECPGIEAPDYKEIEHGLYVENACTDAISFMVRYQPAKDKWVNDGWWKLEAQRGFFPKDDAKKEIKHLPGAPVYIYGNTEKSGVSWSGKDEKVKFGGKTYNLMKIEPYLYNKADSLILLRCPE